MYTIPPQHTKQRKAFEKKDLPIPAVFESQYKEMCIKLLPMLEFVGEDRRLHRVPETGFQVKFKGFAFSTQSKAVVEALMSSQPRVRGKIFPARSDPTGFWRATCGAEMKIVTREVLEVKNVGAVQTSDLNFAALKGLDPEAKVPSLVVVAESLPEDMEEEKQPVT